LFSPSAALLPEIRADIGGLLHAPQAAVRRPLWRRTARSLAGTDPTAILTRNSPSPAAADPLLLGCSGLYGRVLTNWPGAVALTMVLIA